jgi:hypothetical protein
VDVYRIVTRGSTRAAYRRSSTSQKAEWLNSEVQGLIDPPHSGGWHELIKGPFRHPVPISPTFSKRFLPPYWHKNAFFAAYAPITSIHEVAFYFLRERIGRDISSLGQARTLFSVAFDDPDLVDLSGRVDISQIMDRNDHTKSHQVVRESPETNSFGYPSCRDPNRGGCIVTYKINCLGKTPKTEQQLYFSFDAETNSVEISAPITTREGLPLRIRWDLLSGN